MKTLITIIILTALTSIHPQRGVVLMLGAGGSVPAAPKSYSDYWNTGLRGEGFIGYESKNLLIGLMLSYAKTGLNEEKYRSGTRLPSSVKISGGGISIFDIMALAKIRFSTTPTTPYLLLGIGSSGVGSDDFSLSGPGGYITLKSKVESGFSGMAGFGFEFAVSPKASLFIDARYHRILNGSEGTTLIPITGGVLLRFDSHPQYK